MSQPSITFTGTINFTPGCAECVTAVKAFVAAALANTSVSQVRLQASKLHAHPVSAATPPPPRRSGPPITPGDPGVLFPSDTNGSDPDDVQRWMERETGG